MELRERGYSGGYTMLKEFAASLRPQQVLQLQAEERRERAWATAARFRREGFLV